MVRDLRNMVVVITGASAGIGRALAIELNHQGARLVLAARRVDRLEEIAATFTSALVVPTDVADPQQCAALIDSAINRFGRIDTLVCNAGFGFLSAVAQTPRQRMRQIFATNVFGTTDCIAAAVPHMRTQAPCGGWRGQVMIVSSVVARRGLPFFGPYSATKAAQLSLAEAMRVELAPDRIAVTSVHPIGVDTEFSDVSASLSGGARPGHVRGEFRQSARLVAAKMVRAIRHPGPELWPFPPARILVAMSSLFPRLADSVLASRRQQIAGNAPSVDNNPAGQQ